MKALIFLPPALALATAGLWLGSQRRSIATIEERNTALRQQIHAAQLADGAKDGKEAGTKTTAAKKDEVDWKKIAGQLGSMDNGGMPDMRAVIRLQQRVLSMEKEEIIAALDEIAALDLDEHQRMMLEQLLLGAVADKDPELVLTRFVGRIGENFGAMSWQLTNALGAWAKKDQAAATAWFDREIAKGTFDSKSLDGKDGPRPQFERALLGALIANDPQAAGRRLAALPDDERADALRGLNLENDDQRAFADLVRRNVPDEKQADIIAASMPHGVHSGNFKTVSEYLDRIDATPAERDATVDRAGENRFGMMSHQSTVTRDSINEFRTWADTASPGSADRATGKAFARILNMGEKNTQFAELAAMATEYHQSSGNDDLLIPLASHWRAQQNKEEARELAGRISDEKRRQEILEKLK